MELITRLVARGLGVALLPSAFIRPLAARDPGLALVPVADGPRRVEYLAWSRFPPSPATRAMLDVLGGGRGAGAAVAGQRGSRAGRPGSAGAAVAARRRRAASEGVPGSAV